MNTDSLAAPARNKQPHPAFAYLRREIGAFIHFLRKPHRHPPYSVSSRSEAGKRLLLLFSLLLILDATVFLPLNKALEHLGGFSHVEQSGLFISFLAMFVIPVFEELIFRAGLRNATYSLFVGPVFITLYVGGFPFFFVMAPLMIGICIVQHLIDKRKMRLTGTSPVFTRGRRFLKLYPLVFWMYAIVFAVAHTNNYQIDNAMGLLAIFAVGSPLFGALCLGYLRLRDGLASAMLLHALNNTLAGALFSLIT